MINTKRLTVANFFAQVLRDEINHVQVRNVSYMKTIRKIEKGTSHCFARLRVAAYCRVSTDQYEQLESLETQRSHYDEYVRAHKDWELVNVYYDEGISSTNHSMGAFLPSAPCG